jgi:Mg-chelatase subunit ChlD
MKQKRGVFFSIDAAIALMLIVTLVGAGYLVIRHTQNTAELHYDVLNTLGAVKIGEVNDAYIQSLISSGQITDTNTSALEIIGRYYVTNKTRAGEIASVFLDKIETKENIGIWYGSTLIASNNATPYENANQIDTVRQFVTGIQEGESVTGFSARSFLSSRAQTKYVYIGGYVGDGNLTLTAEYYGNLTKATLELAAGKNYTFYVNGVYAGAYNASTTIEQPLNFTILPSLFHTGINTLEFRGSQLYIAGGMLKMSYEGDVDYTQLPKQYIPGVKGIVNIYDGLSVPSTLKQMSISLHYNSTQPVKMLVGNVTVFNSSSSGETTVVLSNTQLATILNYNALSNTTTPIRVWIENTSFTGVQQEFDVVLITDISGSMDWRLDSDTSGTARNCDSASLTASSTKRISLAKCLDKDFAQTILNSSTLSRVGLVSFSNDADSYIDLTRNFTLLNNTISGYSPSGATCVSCAINRAHTILQSQSNSSRMKFIVVMTDGVTNRRSTNTCTDLSGIGALTKTMAVGSSGVIINRTTTEWSNITSSTSNTLQDIDMLNDTTGFAVGDSGTILRWNGTRWINQTSPVTSTLYRVDWFNNTFALAVGASGRVLRWNGTAWSTAATIPNSPTLYGVSIFNTTHALAVGSYSNRGRIYRSTNGGTTWTLDYSDSSNTNLEAVDVVNTTRAYAVGDDGLIVRFNAGSWATQSSPTSQNLYAVEAKNSTYIEALGGDAGQSIIIRTTGGSSWTSVYSTQEDVLHDLIHLNGSAYAVGEGGLIVEYTTVWNRTFAFPLAYEGVSSSGISCTVDGDACTETNSFAALNANYSSCRTRALINTTVYSVGFGPISTCNFALRTMQGIASCGNGTFYASSNASALQQIYSTIAQDIVQIAYSSQSSQPSSGFTSQIFSDSYIEVNYTTPSTPFGLRLSTETSFSNTTNAQFSVPSSVTVTEARVTSYSGARWTQLIKLNNVVAYNLTHYGQTYLPLGDPFVVTLPTSALNTSNTLTLTTAAAPTNISGGSIYNKVIQTFVKNATGYSPIAARAAGCIWTIDFEDNTNLTINIPSNYAGAETCRYQTSSLVYDANDAAQAAAYNLLAALDLDSDLKVDLTLTPSDIEIELSQLTGIPYTWATEVQIRVWR